MGTFVFIISFCYNDNHIEKSLKVYYEILEELYGIYGGKSASL